MFSRVNVFILYLYDSIYAIKNQTKNEKRFIQWGRVHVLDTTQGVVIKRIYDDGDSIRCNSFNTEYPDFSIPKEDIRSFNLVVGSVRL